MAWKWKVEERAVRSTPTNDGGKVWRKWREEDLAKRIVAKIMAGRKCGENGGKDAPVPVSVCPSSDRNQSQRSKMLAIVVVVVVPAHQLPKYAMMSYAILWPMAMAMATAMAGITYRHRHRHRRRRWTPMLPLLSHPSRY